MYNSKPGKSCTVDNRVEWMSEKKVREKGKPWHASVKGDLTEMLYILSLLAERPVRCNSITR